MNEKPLNLELRNALFVRRMTQAELAQKAAVPREYISSHINGHWRLKEEQKKAIADVLGQPVQELFDVV